MSTSAAAVLTSVQGGRIALENVAVAGGLRDLLAEVSVIQTYRNTEAVNIEAVYTFPLPLDAVLLELTVTLGERVLRGHVAPRAEAEARYEEAVTEGDAATLLEQVQPELYTMNVGNLLPGETAVIRFRYAMLQRWSGDQLRLALPTTMAPRYGDPGAAGLALHQQPEHDLFADLRFSLDLKVTGLLAGAEVRSPSHPVVIERDGASIRVRLARESAALDRDLVLSFRRPEGGTAAARLDRDLEGHVALASFKPDFSAAADAAPRNRTLVIDCSGSMGGDSIAQAREALRRILASMRAQDHFEIIAFGNRPRALFGALVPAYDTNLIRARRFVETLDANMGGTEIGAALEAAYGLRGELRDPGDILLVTDGEVWDDGRLLRRARESGRRFFTVGVGSAVAERLVRELAEVTGGACELVSPNESMAGTIHRHFRRLCAPAAESVAIAWPGQPGACFPEVPGPVFEGDTLHAFAWYDSAPAGEVALTVTLPGRAPVTQRIPLVPAPETAETADRPSTLARMAVAARLRTIDEAATGQPLALDYGLMSPWTSYLVVDVRNTEAKATDLPVLRTVLQPLAAGWGGLGGVTRAGEVCASMPPASLSIPLVEYAELREPSPELLSDQPPFMDDDDRTGLDVEAAVEALNRLPSDWFVPRLRFTSLDALAGAGLPSRIIETLRRLVDAGQDEAAVVRAFLQWLDGSDAGQRLDRAVRRAIRKAVGDTAHDPELRIRINLALRLYPLEQPSVDLLRSG